MAVDLEWLVYFSEAGLPFTGASGAVVNIRRTDTGALVVTAGALTELGDGWYKYLQINIDETLRYVATFDGDTVSDNAERYVPAADTDASVRKHVREVHLIHGLDPGTPLIVDASTPTGSRDAGADIEQTIATVGNISTVTRVP